MNLFTTILAVGAMVMGNEIKAEEYEIVTRPAMTVVGIECRTMNEPGHNDVDLPALWGRFMEEGVLDKIPNKISEDLIGLYCEYEGNYAQPYTAVIGCQVSSTEDLPEGFVAKELPEAKYKVFKAVGECPQSVIEMWFKIWSMEDTLNRTYTGDFEVYGEKAFQDPKTVEIYIAVDD